jgi:hypothetical protein
VRLQILKGKVCRNNCPGVLLNIESNFVIVKYVVRSLSLTKKHISENTTGRSGLGCKQHALAEFLLHSSHPPVHHPRLHLNLPAHLCPRLSTQGQCLCGISPVPHPALPHDNFTFTEQWSV